MATLNFFHILALAEGESGDAAVRKIVEQKTAKAPPSVRKQGNARGDNGKGRGSLAPRREYEKGRGYYNGRDNYYNASYKENMQQYYNSRSSYYNARYNGGSSYYYGRRGDEESPYPWHQNPNHWEGYSDGTRQVRGGYSTARRRIYEQKERDGVQCMSKEAQRDGGEANVLEANANNCNVVPKAEIETPARKSGYNRNGEGYKRGALKEVITGREDTGARDSYTDSSNFAPGKPYNDRGNDGSRGGYVQRGNHCCNIMEFLKPSSRPRRDLYGGDCGAAPGRGNGGFMGRNYHHNDKGYRKYAPKEIVTTFGYANLCDNVQYGGYNGGGSDESREGDARHGKGGLGGSYSGHGQHVSLPNLDSEAQFPALVSAQKHMKLEG